jgi:glycosyltransferase involved in cell wall biosynthesis
MTTHSLIVPIYRNEENIQALVVALEDLKSSLRGELEVVFVIDGSPDQSGELLIHSKHTFPSKTVFHSRNFGSFAAIRTGMEYATGQYIAAMAADLQEPPQLILEFFKILSANSADVVFGQRTGRDDPITTRLGSRLFWGLYRRFVLRDMPSGGVDIFACNRQVLDTVLQIQEPNSSLVSQLFWVGFRRAFVPYSRRPREHGKSAWSFSRRFRYMMDSIFSFSDLPIMLVLWVGVAGCLISTVFGFVTLVARALGYIQVPGYTTLAILIAFFGSLLLAVQGILGCYLWRALENTKHRPLRIVSRTVVSGDRTDS